MDNIKLEVMTDDLWWYEESYTQGMGTCYQISSDTENKIVLVDIMGNPLNLIEKPKIGFV